VTCQAFTKCFAKFAYFLNICYFLNSEFAPFSHYKTAGKSLQIVNGAKFHAGAANDENFVLLACELHTRVADSY
jgi:hypothetical protein